MNVRLLFALICITVLCGCSEEGGAPLYDNIFSLVTSLGVESVVPPNYVEGEISQVLIVANCRYSGRGRVHIRGYNGGQDNIGSMVSPISGALGVQTFAVNLAAGRTEIPVEILMTPDYHHVALGITVACDSVLIGDRMEYWSSDAALAAYESESQPNTVVISNNSFARITMDRAAVGALKGCTQ